MVKRQEGRPTDVVVEGQMNGSFKLGPAFELDRDRQKYQGRTSR
jgi:hypothetical protein